MTSISFSLRNADRNLQANKNSSKSALWCVKCMKNDTSPFKEQYKSQLHRLSKHTHTCLMSCVINICCCYIIHVAYILFCLPVVMHAARDQSFLLSHWLCCVRNCSSFVFDWTVCSSVFRFVHLLHWHSSCRLHYLSFYFRFPLKPDVLQEMVWMEINY